MCRLPGADGTWMVAEGGMGAVSGAFAEAAAKAGARLVTGAEATALAVSDGAVSGVVLADGREVAATAVLAACDPWRTARIAGADAPAELVSRLDRVRRPGTTLKINLALRDLPRLRCLPPDAPSPWGSTVHLLPDATGRPLTAVRAMWDDVEAGRLPDFPTMEWYIHTTVDPTLRDDAGHHSSALFVQSVPYDLAGSTWTQALEPYVEHLIGLADTFAPGTAGLVADTFPLPPPAIEEHFGITGGHIHHVDNTVAFADRIPYVTGLPGSTPAAPAATRPAPSSAPRVEQCAPTVARHGTRPEVSSASSSAQVGSTRAAPGPVDNRRRIHRLEAPTSLYHEQLDCRAGKQAKAPVTAQTGPLSGFGPNEWLVQELYESWREDPASVERSWAEYFAGLASEQQSDGDQRAGQPSREAAVSTSAEQARTDTGPDAEAQPARRCRPDGRAGRDRAAAQPGPAKAGPATPTDAKAKPPTAAPAAGTATKPATTPASTKPEPAKTAPAEGDGAVATTTPLRGSSARVVANMESSLEIPTATSVRAVPAKLLIDNRIVINNHLARSRGGKVSFTHVIGFALVKALRQMPEMNYSYDEVDGKPVLVKPAHVNLGLAIDMQKKDGTRQLLVPSIKRADTRLRRVLGGVRESRPARPRRSADRRGLRRHHDQPDQPGDHRYGPLGAPADEGPGHDHRCRCDGVSRRVPGCCPETLARMAVSKVMTLTSTYDHRIIQGAQSGDFLRVVHGLLLGNDDFYDEIFRALRIPYEPIRWAGDVPASHEDEVGKQARVLELIHAYRVRGHLMADTDPLEYKQRSHPDLDVTTHGLTLWDWTASSPPGRSAAPSHSCCSATSSACCATRTAGRASSTCTSRNRTSGSGSSTGSSGSTRRWTARTSFASCTSSTRQKPSRRSCRPSTSARSGSRSKAASRRSRCSTRSARRPPRPSSTRSASGWPTEAG